MVMMLMITMRIVTLVMSFCDKHTHPSCYHHNHLCVELQTRDIATHICRKHFSHEPIKQQQQNNTKSKTDDAIINKILPIIILINFYLLHFVLSKTKHLRFCRAQRNNR